MENLPFLQPTDPRQVAEDMMPEDPSPPPPHQEPWVAPQLHQQFFDGPRENGIFKNPLTILLLGIVIGALFVSMRPIIVQKL